MKKLNKLAVVAFAVAVMLLCGQSVFAWVHEDITTTQTRNLGNLTVDGVDYAGNGGVFNVKSGVTFTITGDNIEFCDNSATGHGGAIYNEGQLNITGSNLIFRENSSSKDGGVIYNEGSDAIINIGENAKFIENSFRGAGAITLRKGTVNIGDNSEFTKNKSLYSFGGAIVSMSGKVNIGKNAKFVENDAKTYAGALSNNGTGVITIEDGAKFIGNTAHDAAKCWGGAIGNYDGGTINLIANTNNVEFTGNKHGVGTENEESNAIFTIGQGTVNLWAGSASIIFNDKIKSQDNLSTLNINQSSGTLPTTGKVILNEDMSEYTGTVNFYGGTIELGEKGKWFGGDFSVEKSATIDMANGICGEHNFKTVTAKNNLKLVVDADLEKEQMDTISATKFEGAGKITVNKVKIIKDTEKKAVNFTFANDKLKGIVEFNGNAKSLLYKYDTTYNKTTGIVTFVNNGGINMDTAAGAVAASVGGYATQSVVINQAFAGIDRQPAQKVQPKTVEPKATVKPSQTPTDKKGIKQNSKKENSSRIQSSNPQIFQSSKLYASAGNQIFDDSGKIERSLWLRPFALQEKIKLNGVDIDNTLYGTLAGIDFIANQDSSIMTSFYIGYAGSKQEFDEVKTNQTGYVVGLTGMLIKEKWYLGVTVNGMFNKVSADSEGKTNDFDMNMFTVGAKAGYNIDLSDKWILEPNITFMYGIANSGSYKTTLGSIDSQSTSNILAEPQVKAKWQLTNGWQPYGLVGYSANLSNKPKVKAGGQELELDSIDGFVEYGIGVNKEFIGSVWSCYGQVTGRSGGRNGCGGNLGIKYKF